MLLGCAVLSGGIGCQPSPLAERRVRMRTDRLQTTVRMWADVEEQRPKRVQQSLGYIPLDVKRQVSRLEHAREHIADRAEYEVERWKQRQPVYLRETARSLWGKPDQIEQHAIVLFF